MEDRLLLPKASVPLGDFVLNISVGTTGLNLALTHAKDGLAGQIQRQVFRVVACQYGKALFGHAEDNRTNPCPVASPRAHAARFY